MSSVTLHSCRSERYAARRSGLTAVPVIQGKLAVVITATSRGSSAVKRASLLRLKRSLRCAPRLRGCCQCRLCLHTLHVVRRSLLSSSARLPSHWAGETLWPGEDRPKIGRVREAWLGQKGSGRKAPLLIECRRAKPAREPRACNASARTSAPSCCLRACSETTARRERARFVLRCSCCSFSAAAVALGSVASCSALPKPSRLFSLLGSFSPTGPHWIDALSAFL